MDYTYLVEEGSYKDAEQELTAEQKSWIEGMRYAIESVEGVAYYYKNGANTSLREQLENEVANAAIERIVSTLQAYCNEYIVCSSDNNAAAAEK